MTYFILYVIGDVWTLIKRFVCKASLELSRRTVDNCVTRPSTTPICDHPRYSSLVKYSGLAVWAVKETCELWGYCTNEVI